MWHRSYVISKDADGVINWHILRLSMHDLIHHMKKMSYAGSAGQWTCHFKRKVCVCSSVSCRAQTRIKCRINPKCKETFGEQTSHSPPVNSIVNHQPGTCNQDPKHSCQNCKQMNRVGSAHDEVRRPRRYSEYRSTMLHPQEITSWNRDTTNVQRLFVWVRTDRGTVTCPSYWEALTSWLQYSHFSQQQMSPSWKLKNECTQQSAPQVLQMMQCSAILWCREQEGQRTCCIGPSHMHFQCNTRKRATPNMIFCEYRCIELWTLQIQSAYPPKISIKHLYGPWTRSSRNEKSSHDGRSGTLLGFACELHALRLPHDNFNDDRCRRIKTIGMGGKARTSWVQTIPNQIKPPQL